MSFPYHTLYVEARRAKQLLARCFRPERDEHFDSWVSAITKETEGRQVAERREDSFSFELSETLS